MSIIIRCIRGDGTNEAEPISDSLIITERMAVLRGKRFLDDPDQGGYYEVKKRTLKTIHKGPDIVKGSWISVTDSSLGLSATQLKVTGIAIDISRSDGVWASIETEQYIERQTNV
jgi:hypothetical protein